MDQECRNEHRELRTLIQKAEQHAEDRLKGHEQLDTQRHQDGDRSIQTAQRVIDSRLMAMNEFRDQQRDIIATFLPRLEYDARHDSLQKQVSSLEIRIIANESRGQGLRSGWMYLVGFFGVVAAIATAVAVLRA